MVISGIYAYVTVVNSTQAPETNLVVNVLYMYDDSHDVDAYITYNDGSY